MKRLILLSTLLAFAALAGCNRSISEDFDYGELKDGVYTNDYFGMTIDIPQDWISLSQEEIHARQNAGLDAIIENEKSRKKAQKMVDVQTAVLLFVGQEAVGSVFNLQLIAENIKHTLISDGEEYMAASTKALKSLNMPFEDFDTPVTKETIGGKDFYVKTMIMNLPQIDMWYRMYATVMDGFSLSFAASYTDIEHLEAIEKVIATTKFE